MGSVKGRGGYFRVEPGAAVDEDDPEWIGGVGERFRDADLEGIETGVF